MTEPRVTILDVGQGLCAVLQDGSGTVLFDVPGGRVPVEFLRNKEINVIDAMFISHFHSDHCGGATGFLGDDFHVRRVFMNAPRAPETETFEVLSHTLDLARQSGLYAPHPRISQFDSDVEVGGRLDRGDVEIVVVGPDAVAARRKRDTTSHRYVQSEHSACGVARIDYQGRQRVLLTGDLNDRGLAQILEGAPSALRADVLVYPHHGGASDVRDERAFAEQLADVVRPELVVFSLARKKGTMRPAERPHPAVLDGLRASVPGAHVVCTQLSRRCDTRDPLPPRDALARPPAAGRVYGGNACCGGSVEISLAERRPLFTHASDHAEFVGHGVERAQCYGLTLR